jgi:hypothetical protein
VQDTLRNWTDQGLQRGSWGTGPELGQLSAHPNGHEWVEGLAEVWEGIGGGDGAGARAARTRLVVDGPGADHALAC